MFATEWDSAVCEQKSGSLPEHHPLPAKGDAVRAVKISAPQLLVYRESRNGCLLFQ